MLTDSNFGNADILPVAFSKLRTAFRQISCIPVVTGFIGKDKEGNITTVGRGGSDYTACILGAALRADEIQIWTNVNGIMTADPKVIDDARNIEAISYEEEAELEFLGSKTLHPKGIRPAMENSIPVRILNTMQPEQEGTLICRDIKEDRRIASITSKEEIEVICVKNQRKLLENGMLLKIIRVLERKGIWIDLILTSKSGVTMTLNQSNGADISAVAKELEQLGDVTVKTNMAKISLVGKSITSIEGISGRILSAVASIPIEAISVGGSETSESFIVRQEDAARAIRLLHTEFF
jgi:aspartate kinase